MKRIYQVIGSLLLATIGSHTAIAAEPAPTTPVNPYLQGNPFLMNVPLPIPNLTPLLAPLMPLLAPALAPFMAPVMPTAGPKQPYKPWTMSPSISKEEKTKLMKQMMPMMNMGMKMDIKDTMNFMTTKYKANKDVAFDDVVESMKLRANSLNFKLVGHSPMWKDIQAVLGDTESPRMEVFHFCDIAAGREIMKLAPESIVYLPCRIAVMEDAEKNIWVLTLDWDIAWLDSVNGTMGINPELAKMAKEVRDKMDNIMQAGANGDL